MPKPNGLFPVGLRLLTSAATAYETVSTLARIQSTANPSRGGAGQRRLKRNHRVSDIKIL
ncbi:MAG: hypothetical protein DME19_19895 [Verrucomicrobia bacterium]|nr:MAG: hypothetical protein DME19_19895 [Verrucomicrobiota bacterium]